jgi:uncharacterized Rossmann fold enzyme
VCVVDDATLAKHKEHAAGLGHPRLAALPKTKQPLAIVGTGPSVDWRELAEWSGDIMAINGAHDALCQFGRVPDWVVCLDPQEALADYHRCPQGARYLVATCCHPAVFEALRGQDVTTWDAAQGDDEVTHDTIPGGSTALTRAPLLAYYLGYRNLTLFGADSGTANRQTTPQLMAQAEYLVELIRAWPTRIDVRGDSLLTDMLRSDHAAV